MLLNGRVPPVNDEGDKPESVNLAQSERALAAAAQAQQFQGLAVMSLSSLRNPQAAASHGGSQATRSKTQMKMLR